MARKASEHLKSVPVELHFGCRTQCGRRHQQAERDADPIHPHRTVTGRPSLLGWNGRPKGDFVINEAEHKNASCFPRIHRPSDSLHYLAVANNDLTTPIIHRIRFRRGACAFAALVNVLSHWICRRTSSVSCWCWLDRLLEFGKNASLTI